MKLSIAVGGASYDPNNTTYSSFEPSFAEDEDERIALPGLVMLPEEPRISYLPPSHPMSQMYLDYSPEKEEESLYF